MRPLVLVPAATALALALSACGSGATTGGTPTPDANTIIGKAFTATSLTSDGKDRAIVPGSTITVTFQPASVGIQANCNSMSGPATYSPTQITVEQIASTRMACEQALMDQDQWLSEFFMNDPAWKVDGTTLTLSQGSNGMVLTPTG